MGLRRRNPIKKVEDDVQEQQQQVLISCPKCNKTFTSQKNLSIHNGWMHKESRLSIENDNAEEDDDQNQQEELPTFTCTDCEKGFNSQKNLTIHYTKAHGKSGLSIKKKTEHHYRTTSSSSSDTDSDSKFVCKKCRREFPSSHSLRGHMASHVTVKEPVMRIRSPESEDSRNTEEYYLDENPEKRRREKREAKEAEAVKKAKRH